MTLIKLKYNNALFEENPQILKIVRYYIASTVYEPRSTTNRAIA